MALDFLSGLSGIGTLMSLENLTKKPTESAPSTSDSITSSSSTPSGGLTTITGPGGKKIVVDQSSSDQIYKNLQDQYNLRNNEFTDWQNRMQAARAAAIPNLHGEASNAQLALRQQQEAERKDRLAMLVDMMAMKGSQAQQNQLRTALEKSMLPDTSIGAGATGATGAGAGTSQTGYVIPGYIQKQILDLANAGDVDAAIKLRDEYQKPAEKARAENIYSIERQKPVLLGIGGHNRMMTLEEAQPYLRGERGTEVTITDPQTGQQLDANGKPKVSPSRKPAAPKYEPDPSLIPKARSSYKEGGAVQNFADGNSVFSNTDPILVADASTPIVPVTAKRIPRPENYPVAPEEVQKLNDIKNAIETTGGNEREKEDALDIKDLEAREKQAINTLTDVTRYKNYLDTKPHIFGPVKGNPILNKIVPVLEGVPGIKNPDNEKSHGLDLRAMLTNAVIPSEDVGDRLNADALATQLGIAYAKLNFPGRMTNMELGQQQRAKGLSVDDPTQSNQHAINLIEHEANKTLGLADAWKRFKIQEEKMNPSHRPTWSNFQLTDAYDHWKKLEPPKENIGILKNNSFVTDKNHVVTKVGD